MRKRRRDLNDPQIASNLLSMHSLAKKREAKT
jgi:hypothetical protein